MGRCMAFTCPGCSHEVGRSSCCIWLVGRLDRGPLLAKLFQLRIEPLSSISLVPGGSPQTLAAFPRLDTRTPSLPFLLENENTLRLPASAKSFLELILNSCYYDLVHSWSELTYLNTQNGARGNGEGVQPVPSQPKLVQLGGGGTSNPGSYRQTSPATPK